MKPSILSFLLGALLTGLLCLCIMEVVRSNSYIKGFEDGADRVVQSVHQIVKEMTQ